MREGKSIADVLDGRADWIVVTGDCLTVLPSIPAGSVGAVVTDPPYGIGFEYATHDDNADDWFPIINAMLPECRRIAPFVISPACSMTRMPWWYANHPPTWVICWHKGSPGHRAAIGFNDWEAILCWGKPPSQMHDHFTIVPLNELRQEPEWLMGHPCRKPEKWAAWLCERAAPEGAVILDPFGGSGTTAAAALKLGRRAILIEKDPGYADIARRRIREAEPVLFTQAAKPEQLTLGGEP